MKITVFLHRLGLGGTEKAAGIWAKHLLNFPGVEGIRVAAQEDGPRRQEFQDGGLDVCVTDKRALQEAIAWAEVVHSHFVGIPSSAAFLADAIGKSGRKIPVVETNVFGKFRLLPSENSGVAYRLFISGVSCVQAARRAGLPLNADFFCRQSVAVYPIERLSENELKSVQRAAGAWRISMGLNPLHTLFGRFSRPEPNKWTPMVLHSFLRAYGKNRSIRLLLQEPPPDVAKELIRQNLAVGFGAKDPQKPILLLPATADSRALAISQSACDVILHTSSIGESFGYGIAEPMALGKPVITHSVPWHDQAQLELVRAGETGLIASVISSLTRAILQLADDPALRASLGLAAQRHISELSDPKISVQKIMTALRCAAENHDNPDQAMDAEHILQTARYLDRAQWGSGLRERLYLAGKSAWMEGLRKQRKLRDQWPHSFVFR